MGTTGRPAVYTLLATLPVKDFMPRIPLTHRERLALAPAALTGAVRGILRFRTTRLLGHLTQAHTSHEGGAHSCDTRGYLRGLGLH